MAKKKRIVPIANSEQVAMSYRPFSHAATGRLAAKLTHRRGVAEKWAERCRAAHKAGEELPDPPAEFDVNTGRLTQKQHEDQLDKWNAGEQNQALAVYNPVEIEALKDLRCARLVRGKVGKHPRAPQSWDDEVNGSWYLRDDDGEYTIPSGIFIDRALPRPCHADIEKMLPGPDEVEERLLFTLGGTRYVVGTGGHKGSVVFWVQPHTGGRNAIISDVIRELCLANMTGLTNLVYRVEDSPNEGGCVKVKIDEDGNEVCFMPGQVLTLGYLYEGDKELAPSQVRRYGEQQAAIDEYNAQLAAWKEREKKGDEPVKPKVMSIPNLRFKKLTGVQTGKLVNSDDFWAALQSELGGPKRATIDKETMRSLDITCRVSPITDATPLGIRWAQMAVVPYLVFDGEGNFSVGMDINSRSNFHQMVTNRDARQEWEYEDEEVTEKPKPKAKAKSKAKSKSKAKAKTKGAKKAKAEETSAAAPVEAEVTTEEEVVEAVS